MQVFIAAAWPYPTPPSGHWDFLPLLWGALLVFAAWAAGIRLRWWGVAIAVAGGLPCEALASHFGPWAGLAVMTMVFAAGLPIARIRPHR